MQKLLLLSSLLLLLVACSNEEQPTQVADAMAPISQQSTSQLEAQNIEQQALTSRQADFELHTEEAAAYQQMLDDYSDAELHEFATKLWAYELQINGLAVPANGLMEVKESDVDVSLVEKHSASPAVANEIVRQGKISGDYFEHLSMSTPPAETYFTDGTVVTAVHYKFVDVEKDTIISFTVTDDLKQRLELETNQIIIQKK